MVDVSNSVELIELNYEDKECEYQQEEEPEHEEELDCEVQLKQKVQRADWERCLLYYYMDVHNSTYLCDPIYRSL